jgi:alginate O-acetyltransferase complex protein AlgI
MPFTSVTFIYYFLPAFLLAYLIAGRTHARNLVLLAASILFYTWGEFQYIYVLLLSAAVNYFWGRWIAERQGTTRSLLLWSGIAINVAGLVIFKYAGFLLRVGDPLLALVGLPAFTSKIHLPIGISFFTFKAISYLVDVHRKDVVAEREPLIFATYLAMFPQILAGPIERFADSESGLRKRTLTLSQFRTGAEYFIIGMAQKLLIANSVAAPANTAFSTAPEALSASLAWLGALCYTIQIYFDFAGYTNMAIGLGHMMGFRFPANFNYPYAARSVTDFWQRWHITLSTWLRDYLWFPLGANRRGRLRTTVNLLLVFGLCGLWHGANYTFIAWGLFHGTLLALERLGLLSLLSRVWGAVRTGYTVLMVMIGWVLFRADSLSYAQGFLRAMAGGPATTTGEMLLRNLPPDVALALAAGILFSFPWPQTLKSQIGGFGPGVSMAWRFVSGAVLLIILIVSLMSLAEGSHNPFIYFRF